MIMTFCRFCFVTSQVLTSSISSLHVCLLWIVSLFWCCLFYLNLYVSWFYSFVFINWVATCKNVSLGKCRQWRSRSDCTSVQSDQGLHCLPTESLNTTECMNREQRPGWYVAHAQNDLHLCIFFAYVAQLSCNMRISTSWHEYLVKVLFSLL